jgi:peptide/nickel transport system permease protein
VVAYLARRIAMFVPVLFAISLVSFVIIDLPPGDFVTSLAAERELAGNEFSPAEQHALRQAYSLDGNIAERYWSWLTGIVLHGDFGRSFDWQRPVADLLAERMPMTIAVSLTALVFTYAVGVPIAIYSATHQYSFADYAVTFLGFVGLAVPGFLLALVLLWFFYTVFGMNVSGLFSPEYATAPWSVGKLLNLLSRIWFPMIILGIGGTAGLIRMLRANLLDELQKPYVVTARAKGLPEGPLLFRYPVRIAINPIVSSISWLLPALVGGEAFVSIVLDLQTTGPLLLQAVLRHDLYLSASIVFILSALTVLGGLVADLVLAWLDPRIRLGARAA